MPDLSVIIPARNEMFLAPTVADVLAHAEMDTEVIVVLDGAWPDPPLEDHPKLRVTHSASVIGQRAATNLAVAMSRASYVMKLDAHCSVDQGFDRKLIEADREIDRPDVTQIPAMYNLHVFNWRCEACGRETYQGPTPTQCASCQGPGPFARVVLWERRKRHAQMNGQPAHGGYVRTEFWRFDHDLHFQYWSGYGTRAEAQGDLVDVMSSIGACFFMRRRRFKALAGLDERHGSWGQYGTEIACQSWLSGGRQIVNKRTWFAHLFRTQGADFSFPYPHRQQQVEAARTYSQTLWFKNRWRKQIRPLAWLIDRFAPVPGWHDDVGRVALARVQEAGSRFQGRDQAPVAPVSVDAMSA